MRVPRATSIANKIAKFLHEAGGATREQIAAKYPGLLHKQIKGATNSMVSENMIEHDGNGKYFVKPFLAKHFDQCMPVAKQKMPIVQPRTPSIWTPEMKGYDEQLRATMQRRPA